MAVCWIHYPTPIKDKGDKEGYFAQCILAVNKGNKLILKPELARAGNTKDIQRALINLCKEFDNLGHCPLQISVPDLATGSILKAFCKALQIKLVKERRPLRDSIPFFLPLMTFFGNNIRLFLINVVFLHSRKLTLMSLYGNEYDYKKRLLFTTTHIEQVKQSHKDCNWNQKKRQIVSSFQLVSQSFD